MVWFDLVIIGIIVVSILVSILRGFIREALSLAAWVLGVLGALRFGPYLAPRIHETVGNESLAAILAFVISFLLLLLIFSLLNMFLVRVLRLAGIGGADRTLGAMFGALRGALVVAVVVMFAELTAVTHSPWWQQSSLVPYFQVVSAKLRHWVPDAIHQPLHDFPTIGKLSEK